MLNSVLRWFSENNTLKYLAYRVCKNRLAISNEDIDPFVSHLQIEKLFERYEATQWEPEINNSFNKIKDVTEYEYLLDIGKQCFIEPNKGLVIFNNNIVYRRSLPYFITEDISLPHYIYYKRKRKIFAHEGLPLFYNWFNYWHFYNDIIGSLMVLDKLKFDKTVPIIVPERAKQVQYVKDFFETDYAKKWNWLFVGHQDYVYLDKAFIVKSFANVEEQFLLAKEIYKSERKTGNRKIFLDRLQGGNGRLLKNRDEIIPIVKDFGFEVVTTEGMTVYEQKAIFETASVILGIHGAGLTNMFFRYPENCTILELFPKGNYPIHYYWLARELKFEYDAIAAEYNEGTTFYLNKEKLIAFLKRNT